MVVLAIMYILHSNEANGGDCRQTEDNISCLINAFDIHD